MTPGAHIEDLKQRLDKTVDEHPISGDGRLIYSDLCDDLEKLQSYYNRAELTLGRQNEPN